LSQFGKVTYFEASKLLLEEVLRPAPRHFPPAPAPARLCIFEKQPTRYSDEMVDPLCCSVDLNVVDGV
jgi:hypothetical protein